MTRFYDAPGTPDGALQRGLGRAAFGASGEAVLRCVVRDYRWDRQVDERAVYLARLVRATRVPVGHLIDLLRAASGDENNLLEVLAALGRAGDAEAVQGLQAYGGDGRGSAEALERHAPRPRPKRDASLESLLADVVNGDRAALRELNRRGPQPALLPLLDTLPVDVLRSPLSRAVELLAEQALPVARRWAATVGHPLRWTAYRVLARHGDDSDAPSLIAGWDWLDTRTGDRCGYDELATGLARIGGGNARGIVPRLRRLWHSPHSYERAAYLRALMTLDHAHAWLAEGLWDCESGVREIAAEHVPLEPAVVDRLAELAADPMEAGPVRAAARLRAA